LKLKPSRPGLKVIDPVQNRPIAEDGSFEIRELDTYWFRALQCGDVIEVPEAPAEPTASPAASTPAAPSPEPMPLPAAVTAKAPESPVSDSPTPPPPPKGRR
jgi:Protein of unknown function (DUF2635)